METEPRVPEISDNCGESISHLEPRQSPRPWKDIIPEYIKGPRRRRKFARNLHLALLYLREDIAAGERFPTWNIEGELHWSKNTRRGQELFSDQRPQPQDPPFLVAPRNSKTQRVRLTRRISVIALNCAEFSYQPQPYQWLLEGDHKIYYESQNKFKMSSPSTQRNNGGVSPSSSPRLPSPPPSVEVQFGPKSPSVSGGVTELSLDKAPDEGASRRIRPGTKAVDMARGPPFVPLHQVESPFQLQEYLQSLYAKFTRDEVTQRTKPIDKETALQLATPPTAQDTGETVDRNLWLYELCRILCNKTTRIIVGFFADNPPCSSQTCPEMRASEWQYLCAVHEPPKSCCAIDYCNHTLDWASNILSSNKHFPSRLALGGESGNAYQSMKQLTNVFRRVYRIYAHAWFQHREVFWSIEAELGLYMFFKTVCDQYQLIPDDNYTIPPEAEGERDDRDDDPPAYSNLEKTESPPTYPRQENSGSISILRKDNEQADQSEGDEANSTISTAATTRRHKHTPSTGVPIDVIAEGQEDEDEEQTTILDLGGPGPAEETTQALLLPAARIDRAKSPGLITIPPITDAERATEDPTPIAYYEHSPFGGPGPTEVTVTVADDDEEEGLANKKDKDHVAPEAGQDKTSDTIQSTSIASTVDGPGEAIETVREIDESAANDSDTDTQVAIEDVGNAKAAEVDNESMEKINVGEIKPQIEEESTKQA